MQSCSRKRVNVVSFTPGNDGQELITRSPDKSHDSCSESFKPDVCLHTSVNSLAYPTATNSVVTCTSNLFTKLPVKSQTVVKDVEGSQSHANRFNSKVYVADKSTCESHTTVSNCLPINSSRTNFNVSYTHNSSGFTKSDHRKSQFIKSQKNDSCTVNELQEKGNLRIEDQMKFTSSNTVHNNSISETTSKPVMRSILTGKNRKVCYLSNISSACLF